jgi:hypothetical protein
MGIIRPLAGPRCRGLAATVLAPALALGCEQGGPTGTASPEGTVHASAAGGNRWYEGGTLHYASMQEWRYAPYQDRLATCGDLVAGAMRARGIPEHQIDMDRLRRPAIELEARITEWASHVDWVVAFSTLLPDGTPRYGVEELQQIAADPRRPVPQTAAALYVYRSRRKGMEPKASDLDASEVAREYLARMAME